MSKSSAAWPWAGRIGNGGSEVQPDEYRTKSMEIVLQRCDAIKTEPALAFDAELAQGFLEAIGTLPPLTCQDIDASMELLEHIKTVGHLACDFEMTLPETARGEFGEARFAWDEGMTGSGSCSCSIQYRGTTWLCTVDIAQVSRRGFALTRMQVRDQLSNRPPDINLENFWKSDVRVMLEAFPPAGLDASFARMVSKRVEETPRPPVEMPPNMTFARTGTRPAATIAFGDESMRFEWSWRGRYEAETTKIMLAVGDRKVAFKASGSFSVKDGSVTSIIMDVAPAPRTDSNPDNEVAAADAVALLIAEIGRRAPDLEKRAQTFMEKERELSLGFQLGKASRILAKHWLAYEVACGIKTEMARLGLTEHGADQRKPAP